MNSPSKRTIAYSQAINEALSQAMSLDEGVICFGLGVDDPKGVFGTTLGLKEKFGGDRVFDMPTSENGMLGVAIGASLNGIKPVMTHQRLDFFLLAMDQLVNNAAKWPYMFGGHRRVPITIRLIVGRGWGQGPTHSQSLHAVFSHIPGIKVVMPAFAEDAKGLLLASIFDPDPVIFIEHRWLHGTEGAVPIDAVQTPIGQARLVAEGNDVTIVSMSLASIEAVHAVRQLQAKNISCDLIDLRTVSPIDWPMIFESVERTGRLLVLDIASGPCSVASEIIARVSMQLHSQLKQAPQRLTLPFFPAPTSYSLTKQYYPSIADITAVVEKMFASGVDEAMVFSHPAEGGFHDVPGAWFKGPF